MPACDGCSKCKNFDVGRNQQRDCFPSDIAEQAGWKRAFEEPGLRVPLLWVCPNCVLYGRLNADGTIKER